MEQLPSRLETEAGRDRPHQIPGGRERGGGESDSSSTDVYTTEEEGSTCSSEEDSDGWWGTRSSSGESEGDAGPEPDVLSKGRPMGRVGRTDWEGKEVRRPRFTRQRTLRSERPAVGDGRQHLQGIGSVPAVHGEPSKPAASKAGGYLLEGEF